MSDYTPREGAEPPDILTLRLGRVDLRARAVYPFSGGVVALTTREVSLLRRLVATPDQVVSCEALLSDVWGRRWTGEPEELGVVRNAVFRLRNKVERDASLPDHILTTQGEGYIFVSRSAVPLHAGGRTEAEPPGDLWSEAWDVGREREEAECLSVLERPHRPLVLLGPWRIGKSWLLRRLVRRLLADEVHVVLDPRTLERELLEDPRQLLCSMAYALAEASGLGEEQAESAWRGPGTAAMKLRRFVDRAVLPAVKGRVVIALEDADRLSRFPAYADVFSMLRAWSEDMRPGWDRVRVVLTTATSPTRLTARLANSPFNLGVTVALDDLDPLAVDALAARYRLALQPAHFEALRGRVGGHPLLLRAIFAAAARQPLDEVLRDPGPALRSCAEELRSKLGNTPGLLEALQALRAAPERPIPDATLDDLGRLGLIRGVRPPFASPYPALDRLLLP